MLSKFQSTHLKASPEFSSLIYNHGCTRKYGYYVGRQQRCRRFKLVAQFLGNKWQLNDINAESVQKNLSKWLSKTQDFLNEVTSSREKNSPSRSPSLQIDSDDLEMEDIFVTERTIQTNTPNGPLSLAALVSIEQFSRLNGLAGEKMQKIFTALVPESVHHDARSLVEYCCFRFLSRDSSDIHPSLKEPAFQRLIFITMVAWENPYQKDDLNASEKASFQKMTVKEAAFVRIAPAVSGIADRSTAHNLFKALAGEEQGISLSLWLKYIDELLKVHEGRKSYQTREWIKPSKERILCIASSRKRPVLKWDKNMAWPGKLTLTDKAIYFEAVDFFGKKDVSRLDLTTHGLLVNKAKVGPLGSVLFDSAVSVSSVSEQKTWILEFVDLGGEMRRDIWYAFISEVISLHKFIHEYGPEDGDESLFHVYNAHKGKERAINSATNTIARLQALQFMRKLLDDPIKLVQFSYLQNSPYGDVVCQTLAMNFWGGPLVSKLTRSDNQVYASSKPLPEVSESGTHVFDIDGSIYLQKWMRSPSWSSSTSIAFWKNTSARQGIVLSKNLVVGGTTLVERAVETCKQKCQVAEKTQATIDAAMIQGIPSNIDLFKELMLPLTMMIHNFEKLRRWEEPHITISFLVATYTVIFRNLLSYMFPTLMMFLAAGMLTLKGLKEQGRLGRSFGKVTIRDQPPSNTIQKIIAVKDAMRDVENHLQNLNVTLLKIRTVILSGQPQITTEVALVLLSSAIILYVVPFKYILAFFVFDLFTRELEIRKETVKRFMNLLRERWASVPAAPVLVLPFESDEFRSESRKKEEAKSEESLTKKPRT